MAEYLEVVGVPTSARDVITAFFGQRIITRKHETDVTVGTTSVQLGVYANTRTEIIIGNTGSATVVISFHNPVTATTGIPITSGSWFSLNWFNDNELVMQDIYAISASSGQTVHVVESVLMGL
jgi:hypothetical protein